MFGIKPNDDAKTLISKAKASPLAMRYIKHNAEMVKRSAKVALKSFRESWNKENEKAKEILNEL